MPLRPDLRADVLEVQRCYPRIYLACHTEHVRASTGAALSQRDGSILAHLREDELTSQADLARHLNVTPATVSEALKKLAGLGYVEATSDLDDERRKRVSLTERGAQAMSASSVLEARRVEALLAGLDEDARRRAVEGLRLLADAALAMRDRGAGG
jgi:DNA-binding MarR family transcriptional regulator